MSTQPTASDPTLTVIIVSWNVARLVEQCIASIYQNTHGLPLEILLVDNASQDDVITRIGGRFPQVRILANDYNTGFPRANNQALARARGRYVLFLNPDTSVGPGTLTRCVAALDEDEALGVVGCRLIDGDGQLQPECGRHAYRLRHLLAEGAYLHMLLPNNIWCGHHRMSWWDHTDVRDVEAVSGAFLMARTELARALGGLPDDFFMYHEDLSFCLRVQRSGYRLCCLGDVWTVHFGGRSSANSPLNLDLLLNEVRVRLIQEAQGRLAGLGARICWGLAGMLRLVVASILHLIPGLSASRARWPRAFNLKRHALQIAWAFVPVAVTHMMPRAAPRAAAPMPAHEPLAEAAT